jgi:hypothetical protein
LSYIVTTSSHFIRVVLVRCHYSLILL